HLLELGHRRIAFISGPHDIWATRNRLAGYREAFARAGIEMDEILVRLGSYSRDFAYSETLEFMAAPDRPTAVVSAGVQGTAAVLAACRELGFELGRDYPLVSCDEIDFMSFVDPPISVVRRDAALIRRGAGELLLEMV